MPAARPYSQARIETLLVEADGTASPVWTPLGSGVGGARWRVEHGGQRWFVKTGDDADMFAAEADGLRALAACAAMPVPEVLHCEAVEAEAFIAMTWLELGPVTDACDARFGEGLAALHAHVGPKFGWHRNNFIGATPQFNTPAPDWPAFYRDHRLGFQLRLAAENGHRGSLQEKGAQLLERLPAFFVGYAPQASLLHGDLWSGNRGRLASGEPVMFDPAVYYGDREADLAMTELFGGFSPAFHAAYCAHAPLDAGYRVRRDLYKLYHLLNHLNLFGAGYLKLAMRFMDRLLSELN